MTPPAATAAARSAFRRPRRSLLPGSGRRVSGRESSQSRAPRLTSGEPARAGTAAQTLALPLGLRIAQRAASLPDARLLDHLLRGRLWIAILAASLVGVVFLQISLLKLNTGISRAVQTTQTLERQNTELKVDLSRMAGGERVRDSVAAMGFVAPAAGRPRFLDAGTATAKRAAANISAPAPIRQLPLGMIPLSEGGTAGVTTDPVADEAVLTAPGGGPVPAGAVAAEPASGTAAAAAVPTTAANPGAAPGNAPTALAVPAAPGATPAHAAHGPAAPAAAASTAPSPPSGGTPAGAGG